MTDYSNISVNSINCDRCTVNTDTASCSSDDCVWIPSEDGGKCVNKCGARLTKGQCEQYHEWNRSKLTPTVYDFSGSDNKCEWHPFAHSVDNTVDSREGDCRPKYFNYDLDSSISSCFDNCNNGLCSDGYTCTEFKEGSFCVPNDLSILGDVNCGFNYNGHELGCYSQESGNCNSGCEKYVDNRKKSENDTGVCVSDGKVSYDLDTGEELGLIMTDEQCGEITDSDGCLNFRGYGCLWEPYNEYCIPTVPQGSTAGVTIDDMYNSCNPIEGHLPGDYDINMIEEQHINVAEFRDRKNIKYPYITSKYLCDVCHIRDNDLDNMKRMSSGSEEDRNNLKYYMIKKYVDFGDDNTIRSSDVSITPQEYCENEIDDNYDIFNPCVWDTSGENSSSAKGGKCVSKCSENNPVDENTTNSQELNYHKQQCISQKWFPETSVRSIEFPNLIRGSESSDDYFEDRYCTWDGFECHNSIPCKFAQQTRCEDLGYEWYEGTALDIMNQPNNESVNLGIPLDLSTSYPIVRKGDGKPVEGDMEGVCIYPNVEAGFIRAPEADYIINPEFIGNQVIMIKWREYGTGWWEDMSCKRKINELSPDMINNDLNKNKYFLGENVALIPFRIEQGDKCDDIKNAINSALQNYQYFVYNGEWVIHAEDIIIHAIDRSYDSCINEADGELSPNDIIERYQKYYGYMYYSNIENLNVLNEADIGDFRCTEQVRRHLNAIYDLRGAINILPVLDQHCALEISHFAIDGNTGNMTFRVETKDDYFDKTKFEFVEFIGKEIFLGSESDYRERGSLYNKLNLTMLSKYDYSTHKPHNSYLPSNIVEGYGTLYENKIVRNIEENDSYTLSERTFDIRNQGDFDSIKNIISKFVPSDTGGTGEYTYTDEFKNWAAYLEFKNFNVFSQPIIEIKSELNKARYIDDNTGSTPKYKLCSGSLESWKINNTGLPQPTYQNVNLKDVDGLLKIMAGYLDDNDNINDVFEIPDGNITTYKDSYQPTDITKSVIWSITRNTPPFWGNLFYNKRNIEESDNASDKELYACCGNFNIITDPSDDNQFYGKRNFDYNLGENTLIKPFCETEYDEESQYIKWKNIMSYTGGNKREIQLSRNVSYENFNNYITHLPGDNRNFEVGQNKISVDTSDFNSKLRNLIDIIDKSKDEYIVRSLMDWKRLNYEQVHPECNPKRPDIIKGSKFTSGSVDHFITNSSQLNMNRGVVTRSSIESLYANDANVDQNTKLWDLRYILDDKLNKFTGNRSYCAYDVLTRTRTDDHGEGNHSTSFYTHGVDDLAIL